METIDYKKFLGITNINNSKNQIKARVLDVDPNNSKALVETIDGSLRIKLNNKTGEMLSAGDYVTIEYTSVLSSKTAYISFRNGSPKFTGYYKVLSQTEYDTLEANGQIIDTVMYVIVGD